MKKMNYKKNIKKFLVNIKKKKKIHLLSVVRKIKRIKIIIKLIYIK